MQHVLYTAIRTITYSRNVDSSKGQIYCTSRNFTATCQYVMVKCLKHAVLALEVHI